MSNSITFNELGFSKQLLGALSDLGYETPSPVQAESIPVLLEGHDLIAQAQTGTGKTAAFALPALANLDLSSKHPQVLVLAPTRELAIQVAEAFQSYARHLKGFFVAPIYGGQEYAQQIRALKRGVQVVVGTPGRVMDHIRKGTLKLDGIQTLVLDEADEMLRMGFLEDVEWVLEQMSHDFQCALFSATMPASIQKVAEKYLVEPKHIRIKAKTMTAASVAQSAMVVSGKHKLEALTRYLEVENFDGVIIFARTKNMTTELAEKLSARGYSVAALNGDMSQALREKVIDRIKRKTLDIVVATDVAARGLDVDRLSHVVNYDAPYDAETYVHRIGRTGRAGREGRSLLLMTPRERHYLRDVERTTKQEVELIQPPTIAELKQSRIENFTVQVTELLEKNHLDYYRELVESIAHQTESSELDVAAALLKLAQKDKPLKLAGKDNLLVEEPSDRKRRRRPRDSDRRDRKPSEKRGRRRSDSRGERSSRGRSDSRDERSSRGRSDSRSDRPSRGRSDSRGDNPPQRRSKKNAKQSTDRKLSRRRDQ